MVTTAKINKLCKQYQTEILYLSPTKFQLHSANSFRFQRGVILISPPPRSIKVVETLWIYLRIKSAKVIQSRIKKIEQLIAEYNLDITTYKYGSKNENVHHQLLSHNSLRIVLRKKLQTSFLEEWETKTSSMSKLSFHRQYKQNHKLENYACNCEQQTT